MAKKSSPKREKKRSEETLTLVAQATEQVTAQHITSPWVIESLAQKFQWHSLFVSVIQAAFALKNRSIAPDLFNTLLILGSRWFSHHEAAELLRAAGRYGDCMVLLRSLLEDTDLMMYFACYPDEASEWKERLSRAPDWSDEVYRRGIQKFRMPNVWKMLKEKGIEPVGERDYPILSTTVHASPWGAQFYGLTFPGDPDGLYLSLAPVYNPAASFSASLVLQGTYPRPIEAFLMSCKACKAPKSKWRAISARYDILIKDWQAEMEIDSWFRIAMADVTRRVSQGEDPDKVIQDVGKIFEEKYGDASSA